MLKTRLSIAGFRREATVFILSLVLLVSWPSLHSAEAFPVLASLGFFFVVLSSRKSFLMVPSQLLPIIIMQLAFLGFLLMTLSTPPLIIEGETYNSSLFARNVFLTALICFPAYVVGAIYSYNYSKAFFTVSRVFTYFLIFYCFYWVVLRGDSRGLSIGIMSLVLFAYAILSPYADQKWKQLSLMLIPLFAITATGNRGSLIAWVFFLITWLIYPRISKLKKMYRTYFLTFLVFAVVGTALYTYGELSWFDGFSQSVFNKHADSGRPLIWQQLLEHISQHLVFGMGANQSSTYILSDFNPARNLSSHNTFIELLLRGGVLLSFVFVGLLYLIWLTYAGGNTNAYNRLGASFFVAILVNAVTAELLLANRITLNLLIWWALGLLSGKSLLLKQRY